MKLPVPMPATLGYLLPTPLTSAYCARRFPIMLSSGCAQTAVTPNRFSRKNPVSTPDFPPLEVQMRLFAKWAYREYKTRGDFKALEGSIQCLRLATNMTADDDPEKADVITSLVTSLHARFKHSGVELLAIKE